MPSFNHTSSKSFDSFYSSRYVIITYSILQVVFCRSVQFVLNFSEPFMTIHGGLERHIKYGSLINLTCEIRDYPGPLNFVIWYRDRESLMRNPRYNIR